MVALEISASAVALLCLLKGLALLEDFLHRLGTHLMTLAVLALSMALQGLLHLCFHVRAAWPWATHMASVVVATSPMAFHNRDSLLASLLKSHPEWLWALLHACSITLALLLASAEL